MVLGIGEDSQPIWEVSECFRHFLDLQDMLWVELGMWPSWSSSLTCRDVFHPSQAGFATRLEPGQRQCYSAVARVPLHMPSGPS